MKFLRCTLLLLPLFLFSCKSADPEKYRSYPKLKEVMDEFKSKVHVKTDEDSYLDLAKKPKGWFVQRKDKQTMKVLEEYLFWDISTKKYSPKNVREGKKASVDYPGDATLNTSMYSYYQYDRQIYFGYPEWADDVLDDLEGADLNDTLTESLARAYANKSMNVIRPESQGYRQNKISESQADEFLSWCDKEIDAYKTIREKNPKFETLIGSVGVKIANTYMYAWSEMHLQGFDDKGKKYLEAAEYDEFMTDFAKNILQSAEKNAIVFTTGDNDTYPIWYAQYKLGVRKDVALINTSLANLPEWLESWKKEYKLAMSIDEKVYHDSACEYLLIPRFTPSLPGDPSRMLSLSEIGSGLSGHDDAYYQEMSRTKKKQASLPSPMICSRAGADSLVFVYSSTSYIFRSDLALMDIISSNFENHPVYFCNTVGDGSDTKNALKRYISSEGLLEKIVVNHDMSSSFMEQEGNLEKTKTNLISLYQYGLTPASSSHEHIVYNYFIMFSSLANMQMNHKDTAAAKASLDFCDTHLFPEVHAEEGILATLAFDYLKTGNEAKGRQYIVSAFKMIRKGMKEKDPEFDASRASYLLDAVSGWAGQYGLTDLQPEIDRLRGEVIQYSQKMGTVAP